VFNILKPFATFICAYHWLKTQNKHPIISKHSVICNLFYFHNMTSILFIVWQRKKKI